MGVCASSSQKSTVEEDAAQTKDQASPLNAHETKQKPPSKIQSRVREQAAKEPSRQNVAVDFEQRNSGASLERKWSRLSSQKSQVSHLTSRTPHRFKQEPLQMLKEALRKVMFTLPACKAGIIAACSKIVKLP